MNQSNINGNTHDAFEDGPPFVLQPSGDDVFLCSIIVVEIGSVGVGMFNGVVWGTVAIAIVLPKSLSK